MRTMCSVKTLPKPGFFIRSARSASDMGMAFGFRSSVGAVSTVLMGPPSSVFGSGAGRMDQVPQAGDALPGDGRIMGGEVEAQAVGAAPIGEEERAGREAQAVPQRLF